VDKYAHIPKEALIKSLKALDVEIGKESIDDFFSKHDLDGNGLFDYDEFKEAILLPFKLPPQSEIRQAFESHSIQSGFIAPEKISDALKNLGLKPKTAENVQAYFEQGALADGKISFEEFNQAILSISPLPDEQEIVRVYQEHAVPGTYRYIPSDKLKSALEGLGLVVTKDRLAHFTRILQLNFKGCIKYNAFKHIVLSPSPVEVWAKTLPLSRLLADALPKFSGCDHLRVISSLTAKEADYVAEEVCAALKEVLMQHVGLLKSAFKSMDEQAVKMGGVHGNSKFEVSKMTVGSIQNFYAGLEARIGILSVFPME
jgi:Ca2+-binding EF-hand superfamily protein